MIANRSTSIGRDDLLFRRPLLSIVTPTYSIERFKDICNLLTSIKKQTYTNIETVLIVENSLELFSRISEFIKATKIPKVHVVFTNHRVGASFEINLGAKEAKGSIIAILADDTVVPPCWAEELIETYAENIEVVGVTGPIIPLWQDASMNWFPEELDWIIGCNRYYANVIKRNTKVRSISGSNLSFRKQAFEFAGGLLTTLGPLSSIKSRWCEIGEETELSLRVVRKVGGYIIFNPAVVVYHKVPKQNLNLRFVLRMSYQAGRTKGILKGLYRKEKHVLDPEFQLLNKILTKTFPNSFIRTLEDPASGLNGFLSIVLALTFVALGFTVGNLFSSSMIKS